MSYFIIKLVLSFEYGEDVRGWKHFVCTKTIYLIDWIFSVSIRVYQRTFIL